MAQKNVSAMLPEEYVAKLQAIEQVVGQEAAGTLFQVREIVHSYNYFNPAADPYLVSKNWRDFPGGFGLAQVEERKGWIDKFFHEKEKLTPVVQVYFDVIKGEGIIQVKPSYEREYVQNLANKADRVCVISPNNLERAERIKRGLESRLPDVNVALNTI